MHSKQTNRKLNVKRNANTLEHTDKPTYVDVVLNRSLTYRFHSEKTCQKVAVGKQHTEETGNSVSTIFFCSRALQQVFQTLHPGERTTATKSFKQTFGERHPLHDVSYDTGRRKSRRDFYSSSITHQSVTHTREPTVVLF